MNEKASNHIKTYYSIEGEPITNETLIQLIENRRDIPLLQLSIVIKAIEKEIKDALSDLSQ